MPGGQAQHIFSTVLLVSLQMRRGKIGMEIEQEVHVEVTDPKDEDPLILEEIAIEEIFVDGICGVY